MADPKQTDTSELAGQVRSLNSTLWIDMTDDEIVELLEGAVCMYGKKTKPPDW